MFLRNARARVTVDDSTEIVRGYRNSDRSSSGASAHAEQKVWPIALHLPVNPSVKLQSKSAPLATMVSHVLFETASGYAIFEAKLHEDIGAKTPAAQASITDFAKFSKMVSLMSFSPFKSAAEALENANDVSEGACYAYRAVAIC